MQRSRGSAIAPGNTSACYLARTSDLHVLQRIAAAKWTSTDEIKADLELDYLFEIIPSTKHQVLSSYSVFPGRVRLRQSSAGDGLTGFASTLYFLPSLDFTFRIKGVIRLIFLNPELIHIYKCIWHMVLKISPEFEIGKCLLIWVPFSKDFQYIAF